jgi:osmoprotectant transport system ATP-binding protein
MPTSRSLDVTISDQVLTPNALANSAVSVELRDVGKQFGSNAGWAVERLNLTVKPGEVCVLVGPSGCGKTTALKMINRLVEPTTGDVLIDGDPASSFEVSALRRRIGYVIQQVGLLPHLSVAANVAVVPRLLGWERKAIDTRVGEMLELVGLPATEFGARYPSELSGGQQQRVGLARALAADPPLMLMDEPFSAVDPITRSRLQGDFLRLHRTLPKTVVFVTHDIDEAVRMADRIAVMREGHLLQYTTPAELLSSPADDFVREFVGADRALKRMALTAVKQLPFASEGDVTGPDLSQELSVRDALSALLDAGATSGRVVGRDGEHLGFIDLASIARAAAPVDGVRHG